jgi:hypothetical protein
VSVTSPARLALLALMVASIRHVMYRRPSLPEWLWSVRPHRPQTLSTTARVWAASRISVIVVGYFAVVTIGFPHDPPYKLWDGVFMNLPARWDAGWYLDIAANGYRWGGVGSTQANVAFFPAFPLAMGVGGALLGAYAPGMDRTSAQRRLLLSGWLVALGAFWGALAYVYRWSDARAGPAVARATITLLAAYPFAVFFSAPYSEPVFLLATAGAFVHFERAEWGRAAAWAFVVGLARPSGVLLAIPLALMAMRGRRKQAFVSWPSPAAWIVLAAPAAAIALHMQHLRQVTGQWFAWSEVQVAWGRTYEVTSWLGTGITDLAEQGAVRFVEGSPIIVLNGLAAIMALMLLWRVTKAAGLPYTVFVLVTLVPAIASGGLMSLGRFTSTLFPLFFALAVSMREQHVPAWVLAFGILQGLLAALFFTWRPLV